MDVSLQKEDYLLATSCGLIAGLIDVIFVGDPTNSILGKAVDNLADNYVIKAAHFFYDMDKRKKDKPKKKPENLHDCISYLEQAFLVRYDARYAKDLTVDEGLLKNMSSSNHHLMSLAHSTDPIGLVFSIIDQFHPSNKASFLDNGSIIRCVPKKNQMNGTPYLLGRNQTSKIFCGFINWIGHLSSDLVGSSSTRDNGKTGRGMGITMPFFELSQLINVRDFYGQTFADAMMQVYEQGYDYRFGVATAIPVVIEELLVRCTWTLRQKLYYRKSWKESLPSSKNDNFRLMLLLSTTTLNVVDGAGALISAIDIKGNTKINMVRLFSNVNYVGIVRLTQLLFKECALRINPIIKTRANELTISIFGGNPDSDKSNYLVLCENVKNYLDCLDYQNTINDAIKEYKHTKEERIKIEAQTNEIIEKLEKQRLTLCSCMETYFSCFLITINEGVDIMDKGIIENDSNQFIRGNNMIQTGLNQNIQFENQKEFDKFMDIDNELFF